MHIFSMPISTIVHFNIAIHKLLAPTFICQSQKPREQSTLWRIPHILGVTLSLNLLFEFELPPWMQIPSENVFRIHINPTTSVKMLYFLTQFLPLLPYVGDMSVLMYVCSWKFMHFQVKYRHPLRLGWDLPMVWTVLCWPVQWRIIGWSNYILSEKEQLNDESHVILLNLTAAWGNAKKMQRKKKFSKIDTFFSQNDNVFTPIGQ